MAAQLGEALWPALKELFALVGTLASAFMELGGPVLMTLVIPAIKELAEALAVVMHAMRALVDAIRSAFGSDPTANARRGVRGLNAELEAAKKAADGLASLLNLGPGGKGKVDIKADTKGPAKVEVVRDDSNDIGPNSTLSPEERLRLGLRLKPGEMDRARKVPEPSKPSEYFDFIGFNRMIQGNLTPKDNDTRTLITTVNHVTFEIEKQTAEMTRIGTQQNAMQQELIRRLGNGVARAG